MINIQRKFSYLQSIPGIYAVQRPYLPPPPLQFQYPQSFNNNQTSYEIDKKCHLIGTKRFYSRDIPDDFPTKSVNLGYNSPNNGIPSGASSSSAAAALWSMSIPPLLPCTPCNPIIPKIISSSSAPAPVVYHHGVEAINNISMLNKQNLNLKTATTTSRSRSSSVKMNQGSSLNEINGGDIKVETSCTQETDQEEKTGSSSHNLGLECRAVEHGFGPRQGGGRGGGGAETALNYI